MFATLLREEVRTQARRNAGAVGIVAVIAVDFTLLSLLDLPAVSSLLLAGALAALGAMLAVVSVQVGIEYWASMYGARGYLTMSLPVRGRVIFAAKTLYAVIAGLVSAAVAALLGVGWLATYVHLRGTTLEELLQAVRQMISMVGAGILVFYGLAVVGNAVVTIIEVAAVMSIGAQGRWNRLGFGGARSRLRHPLRGQPDRVSGRRAAAAAVAGSDQRADRHTHDASAVHRGCPIGPGTATGGNRFRRGGADPGRDPGLVGGACDRAAHLPALNRGCRSPVPGRPGRGDYAVAPGVAVPPVLGAAASKAAATTSA